MTAFLLIWRLPCIDLFDDDQIAYDLKPKDEQDMLLQRKGHLNVARTRRPCKAVLSYMTMLLSTAVF
jgi:hypothetical protein